MDKKLNSLSLFCTTLSLLISYGSCEGEGHLKVNDTFVNVNSDTPVFLGKVGEKEFYVISNPNYPEVANKSCVEAGLSGLAAIESSSENDFLKNSTSLVAGQYYWTDGVMYPDFRAFRWETINKPVNADLAGEYKTYPKSGVIFRAGLQFGNWDFESSFFVTPPMHPSICQSIVPPVVQYPFTYLGEIIGLKRYYVDFTKLLTWEQGFEHCKSVGYQMVSVETQREKNFLMTANLTYGDIYWTSGRSHINLAYFRWKRTGFPVDGTISNYNPELDTAGVAVVGRQPYWHRWPTTNQYNVICELRETTIVNSTSTSDTSEDIKIY